MNSSWLAVAQQGFEMDSWFYFFVKAEAITAPIAESVARATSIFFIVLQHETSTMLLNTLKYLDPTHSSSIIIR